jgi:hypothetical protein
MNEKDRSPRGMTWGLYIKRQVRARSASKPPGQPKSIAVLSPVNPLRFAPTPTGLTGLTRIKDSGRVELISPLWTSALMAVNQDFYKTSEAL